jgi:hypothetical protein
LGRGLFFILTLPLWEGFDEFSHFAVLQHVALEGAFPKAATGNSLEVSRSLRLAPMPWHLRDAPEVRFTHDSYWKQPDRESLRAELSRLDPQRSGGVWVPSQRLYEAQQPPLYYALAALPYRAMQQTDLHKRVYLLRLWNVLLASLAVPLTYLAARQVFGDDGGIPLASALLVVAMPAWLRLFSGWETTRWRWRWDRRWCSFWCDGGIPGRRAAYLLRDYLRRPIS